MRPASSRRAGSVHLHQSPRHRCHRLHRRQAGSSPPRLTAIACASWLVARRGCAHGPGRSGSRSSRAMRSTGTRCRSALAGVDCAYYLIHSMGSGAGFHELDVEAARLFGQVAGGRPASAGSSIWEGWARSEGRPVPAPALQAGDGPGAPGRRGAGDGIQGRGDRRIRQHLLRDDPLSGGASPGDGVPAVGLFACPAYRGERCAGLSGGSADQRRLRRQGHRDRRPRGDHLQGDDAGLCQGQGVEALAGAGAGAHAAPVVVLGALDHADPFQGERTADRRASERGGGHRQSALGSCSRRSRHGTTPRPSRR